MSVASKLVEVMKKVTRLSKDGQMQGGGNYAYLSEEAVTGALHDAFADVGLVIVPQSMAILDDREDVLSSGKIMHNTRIAASYQLIDVDDPEHPVCLQVLGEGSDMGDKCLNKCMTAAYKYALRQSCMISTGDDPDHTLSAEAKGTAKRKAAPPKPDPDTDALIPCQGEECGKLIEGYTTKAGKTYTAEQVAFYSQRDHKKNLCRACSYKEKARKDKAAQEATKKPATDAEPVPTEPNWE